MFVSKVAQKFCQKSAILLPLLVYLLLQLAIFLISFLTIGQRGRVSQLWSDLRSLPNSQEGDVSGNGVGGVGAGHDRPESDPGLLEEDYRLHQNWLQHISALSK